jgi:hypothetical protein
MPEYIAKFCETDMEYYPVRHHIEIKREERFFADDDIKAYKKSKLLLKEIAGKSSYFPPKVELTSLLEIRHVNLSTYA